MLAAVNVLIVYNCYENFHRETLNFGSYICSKYTLQTSIKLQKRLAESIKM